MTDSANPLANFYRAKEIYIKLPTGGQYYDEIPNLSIEGELGIMPMSNRDEVMLKMPDTLYNGESLFKIIQSVAPDIPDAYEVKLPDLDVILVAMRIASYGNTMEVTSKCPHCGENNEYEFDLRVLLSGVKEISDSTSVELKDGITVELQPNSVKIVNIRNIRETEMARLAREIAIADDNDEIKKEKYSEVVENITANKIMVISDGIRKVITPDGTTVTDMQQIVDWLTNTHNSVMNTLENQVEKLNESGINPNQKFSCGGEECGKEYTSNLVMNSSFFFTKK